MSQLASRPSSTDDGYPGMRSTHTGSSYIIGTARAAGSISDLGIAIDTVPGAQIYERDLRNLEAALRRLIQEANTIGETANAIHLKITQMQHAQHRTTSASATE